VSSKRKINSSLNPSVGGNGILLLRCGLPIGGKKRKGKKKASLYQRRKETWYSKARGNGYDVYGAQGSLVRENPKKGEAYVVRGPGAEGSPQ